MGLTILLLSNILLVQVNSSNTESAWHTFQLQLKDKVMWLLILGTLGGLLLMLYTPVNGFLKLSPLSAGQLFLAAGISGNAVLWYELVKAVRKARPNPGRNSGGQAG